jgi:hypothetical protein
MKRLCFIAFFLYVFLFPQKVSASFINVKKTGEIQVGVLSSEDEYNLEIPKASAIEVKKAAKQDLEGSGSIQVEKVNDKVSLLINYGESEKEYSFTKWSDTLIEIEERPELQSIKIALLGDKFSLEQKGFTALTAFPIKVDSKEARLSVGTETGDRILSILPYQAIGTLFKAKVISKVNGNQFNLIEENQELAYFVEGEKTLNLYDIYKYSVPVSAYVSASTGEIIKIEAPIWYKVIGFLFS